MLCLLMNVTEVKRPKFAAQTWDICPRFARFGPFFCLFQTGTTFSKKKIYKIPSMKSSVMRKRTILPRNLVVIDPLVLEQF